VDHYFFDICPGWIRIHRWTKNDPQIKKKSEETSGFEVLDVLFGGLNASPVAWTSFIQA
jgi:hypothetical protein